VSFLTQTANFLANGSGKLRADANIDEAVLLPLVRILAICTKDYPDSAEHARNSPPYDFPISALCGVQP
jgi:hypothetical protein